MNDSHSQAPGYELIAPIERSHSENPAAIYLERLTSKHSRRNLSRYLNQVADFLSSGRCDALTLDWAEVRFRHVATVAAWFTEEYAASTVNGMLSAVRGVLRVALELKQLPQADYEQAIDVSNVKSRSQPAGRVLSFDEIRVLLTVCGADRTEPDAKGRRDAAIIALLYATGMRRSELVALQMEDYQEIDGRLHIGSGEGGQERALYLKNRPRQLLDKWVNIRDDHPGPLFQPVNKGRRILRDEGISAQAVYNMLKARAEEAGVESFSPHDLRRTFVAGALRAGVATSIVAGIAGHASTDTTRRYKTPVSKRGMKTGDHIDPQIST